MRIRHVSSPKLFRDQFPYTSPPRILFDGVQVEAAPATDPHITDTTFRDGQQARTPYTAPQILALYDLMHRLGGTKGLIRQTEFFLYRDEDRRALDLCRGRDYPYPEVTSWIRARKEDFALVKSAGVRETGILTSVSDYHIFLKLGLDREKAFAQYLAIVDRALEEGIRPRCHFEDVTRADVHGFVIPFAAALVERGRQAGIPVKIRLCDTMGYGVFYDGAALPRSVPRLIHLMIHEAGVPGEFLEWHGHNDFHKGLANAVTAWRYGCAAVNGTLLGFGERTGNVPVEGLVFEWMGLTGETDVDTRAVTDIAGYFETELAYRIPPMTPFVGEKMNVTAAGIHADGLLKNAEIYNIFDTEALLGRPPGVMVTDKAGLAGIAFWLNRRLGSGKGDIFTKDHPAVKALHAFVQEAYRGGRTTALSDEELLAEVVRLEEEGVPGL